jgi:hypothetical protein
VGVFGNVADSVASTLAGNFSDAVSNTVLSGTGTLDVGSFVKQVAVGTVKDYSLSQLNQTGLPLAVGVGLKTAAFTSDVYGAFRDVLTPPAPIRIQAPVTAQQVAEVDPGTGKQSGSSGVQLIGHVQRNPHFVERRPRRVPVDPEDRRPRRIPVETDDSEYRIDHDWINGRPLSDESPLRFAELSDLDLDAFRDNFFANVSSGKLSEENFRRAPVEFYSTWDILTGSIGIGAGEFAESGKRTLTGAAQPFVNFYDAGTMLVETGYAAAGYHTRPHTVYGDMAQAAESGVDSWTLTKDVGSSFVVGTADVVTLGGYATYEYNSGVIDDREYGDRLVGMGFSIIGARGRIGSTTLGRTPVMQVPGVLANTVAVQVGEALSFASRIELDTSILSSGINPMMLRLAPSSGVAKIRQSILEGFQEHHIISDKNVLTKNHELLDLAGFDLQSRVNKIFLPIEESLHPTRSIHSGRHLTTVSRNLAEQMDQIVEVGQQNGFTQGQYIKALRSMISEERQLLRSGERALNKNMRPGAR